MGNGWSLVGEESSTRQQGLSPLKHLGIETQTASLLLPVLWLRPKFMLQILEIQKKYESGYEKTEKLKQLKKRLTDQAKKEIFDSWGREPLILFHMFI